MLSNSDPMGGGGNEGILEDPSFLENPERKFE